MESDLSSTIQLLNEQLLAQYPVIEDDLDYNEAFLDGCRCEMCQKVQEMIKARERKTLVTPAQAEELNLHENLGPSFDLFFRES